MRMLLRALLFVLAISPALAGFPNSGKNSSGCAAATTLTGRMDGSQNSTAVTAAVCGMVADSTYSLLDFLYVFAINSTTNANLNWIQNNYNLTKVGSVSFSANAGYTSDGSTGYFTNSFNPHSAGGNWVLNGATIGGCTVTSRNTNQTYVITGGSDGTNLSFVQPYSGSSIATRINSSNATLDVGVSNAQGSSVVSRSSSTVMNVVKNGGTFSAQSQTSTALTNANFYVLAFNNNGSAADFDADQVAYVFAGGVLTQAQNTAIYNRLHSYLQNVGETTAC